MSTPSSSETPFIDTSIDPPQNPPRTIFEEVFGKNYPADPVMAYCMAICAVADEVRALRNMIKDEISLLEKSV